MLKHLTDALIAIGPLGVLALAFVDSTGIPVATGMDALLIFLAVQAPQTALFSAVLAVVGSTMGNLVLFEAARKGGRRFLEKSAEPGRAQRFRRWFERYGLVTIFVPALVPFPMPLKIVRHFGGRTGNAPIDLSLGNRVRADSSIRRRNLAWFGFWQCFHGILEDPHLVSRGRRGRSVRNSLPGGAIE